MGDLLRGGGVTAHEVSTTIKVEVSTATRQANRIGGRRVYTYVRTNGETCLNVPAPGRADDAAGRRASMIRASSPVS